jgi:ATP-dependent DNA helicase RecQ
MAVELLDRQGAWRRLPNRRHYGLIRFDESAGRIRRYADQLENQALGRFVRTILRLVHADAFSEWWPFDARRATDRLGLSRDRLDRGLQYLEERGLLRWRPPGDALQVELAFPRAKRLPIEDQGVDRARERAETRLSYMLRYARGVTCRRRFLLTYFGEASPRRCGTCDVCLGRHEQIAVTPDHEPLLRAILERVREEVPRAEWFEDGTVPRHEVDALLNWLVEQGYVTLEAPLEGTFGLTDEGRRITQ